MSRSKRDLPLRTEIEERPALGVPVEKVFFEYGFKCCIESVRDKGYLFLPKLLEEEYEKIEQLGMFPSQGERNLKSKP